MTDVIADPFAETAAVDEDYDPFASPEDVKASGTFIPRPPIEALEGRTIVIVPRKFDEAAKVSDYLQSKGFPATREEWTVDLVVLNGGTLEYPYRSKIQGTESDYEDKTMTVTEFPFMVPGFKVSWANIIGTVNKLSVLSKPVGIGQIRAGYSAKEMRNGKTFADFAEELAKWELKVKENPRSAGERPKAKWHFVLSSDPQDRALALAWWNQAVSEGYSFKI